MDITENGDVYAGALDRLKGRPNVLGERVVVRVELHHIQLTGQILIDLGITKDLEVGRSVSCGISVNIRGHEL